MKLLKKRGLCIGGCGVYVRKPGEECRNCRRKRQVRASRLRGRDRRTLKARADDLAQDDIEEVVETEES